MALILLGGLCCIVLLAYGVFPWRCPINFLFGIECPGCGTSRSIKEAMRGNLYDSILYNPLGIPILVCLILGMGIFAFDTIFHKDYLFRLYTKTDSLIERHKVMAISICLTYTIAILVSKNT
ncbi:MAG: DUF2752 domain-containing protein [Duncaniella sp.]|nr:DUF2752 domain-containing protein [Duncaniella sp.]